jgi:hypothetical protein
MKTLLSFPAPDEIRLLRFGTFITKRPDRPIPHEGRSGSLYAGKGREINKDPDCQNEGKALGNRVPSYFSLTLKHESTPSRRPTPQIDQPKNYPDELFFRHKILSKATYWYFRPWRNKKQKMEKVRSFHGHSPLFKHSASHTSKLAPRNELASFVAQGSA